MTVRRPISRRLALGFVILAACMLAMVRRASAEPAARFIYLRGAGTETCPSEADVRQGVQVRLGYDPFSSYAASTMFVEVSTTKDGYSANLKLVDGDNSVRGDRLLTVQHGCADLMDAMALTISIAIDPMSVTRNGPPPDAPPVERPVDTTLPSLAVKESEPSHDAVEPYPKEPLGGSKPVLSVSLGPTASLGVAPALSAGGALAIDLQIGRLLGGVEGRVDLSASASTGQRGNVESSTIGGALFAGVRERAFSVCAVGTLGRLTATSSDVAVAKEATALVAATGLRIGLGIPLSDVVEVRARAEILANLTRHALGISGEAAYRYPVASGDVGAALAVRFQ